MRILALLTDSFGGRGGIAQFNRDMLRAICGDPSCDEVIVVARMMPDQPGPIPAKVYHVAHHGGGKLAYVGSVLRVLLKVGRVDLVLCGHLNLLPIAYVAALMKRTRLVLIVHGIEAWERRRRQLTSWLLRYVDAFVAVSDFTKRRLLQWSELKAHQGYVIPNCVQLSRFSPGVKPDDLQRQYGLAGRRVLLTVARLDSRERYKGHDEVIDVLPRLLRDYPELSYLVVGDGDDRPRLERKVSQLGLDRYVVFAGYVNENDKPAHYRLADAFVMPGRGEGFGIVYLEALASGIPIVVSAKDASAEILRDDIAGEIADPDDPESVYRSIRRVLAREHPRVPSGLTYYSVDNFQRRWRRLIHRVIGSPEPVAEFSTASRIS